MVGFHDLMFDTDAKDLTLLHPVNGEGMEATTGDGAGYRCGANTMKS